MACRDAVAVKVRFCDCRRPPLNGVPRKDARPVRVVFVDRKRKAAWQWVVETVRGSRNSRGADDLAAAVE